MIRFIKHQKFYLVFLLSVFVLPLWLFFEFSSYELPKVEYVFLGTLIVSQYMAFNEKRYRRSIEGRITAILKKELGRVPSRKDIIARSGLVISFRGFCVAIASLAILLLMVFYNKF